MTHRTNLKPLEPGCLAMVVDCYTPPCDGDSRRSTGGDHLLGRVFTVSAERVTPLCACCVVLETQVDCHGRFWGRNVKSWRGNLRRIDPDADQREQWAGEEVGV